MVRLPRRRIWREEYSGLGKLLVVAKNADQVCCQQVDSTILNGGRRCHACLSSNKMPKRFLPEEFQWVNYPKLFPLRVVPSTVLRIDFSIATNNVYSSYRVKNLVRQITSW